MRILVVGDWHSDVHEEAVYQAFKTLGHDVHRFAWHQYSATPKRQVIPIGAAYRKFQNKFLVGSLVRAINRDVLAAFERCRPDLVFVYRGTHITGATLRAMKERFPKTLLVGYNNDDPFSEQHPAWLWRHFLEGIAEYDLVLAYRHHNLDEFSKAGAKRVQMLRSWFVPEANHPVVLSQQDRERFECDVVFAGHYEADRRLECLERVAASGCHLRVFGPDYPATPRSPNLARLWPVVPVRGEDYNKALCGAKIALCFLSKLNRDTYTRRCFEIPAAGTFMLSEYSDDLANMYRPGVEADFFRDPDDLVRQIDRYLRDDRLRHSVAEAGRLRVMADGHDVVSRMRAFLDQVGEIHAQPLDAS